MKILPNGVAVIEGDTHHAVWCETEGLIHDKFMSHILKTFIRKYGVTVAIDGGANIGTLSAAMIEAGAEVYAFEPNPEAWDCLRHNCPTAHAEPCGLSDRHEYRKFVREANAGASHVLPIDKIDDDLVKLVPLDAYGINPGLIKLDIEGYEVKALQGALRMITRCRPVIVCEVNDAALRRAGSSEMELYAVLLSLGYKTAIAQPDCKLGYPQYDLVALP